MNNEVKYREIVKLYNGVQRKILLFAEIVIPEKNFQAFRKLVLDEFGHGGAKDKLDQIFSNETNGSKEN